MDNDTPIMEQLLSVLREKHKNMDNIMVFTKEMEKAIEANDLDSLGAVLTMRQDAMDKVDKLLAEQKEIIEKIDQPERGKIKLLLEPTDERPAIDDPLEAAISDTNRAAFLLLKKIIALDENINKRMKQGAPE